VHVVLVSSLTVLALATAGALVLLQRTGDPRALLPAGLCAALAASQGLLLWSAPARELGFDAESAAALLVLAAGLLSALSVVAMARTLGERDRSESLHWSSMETVRAIADLTARTSADLDARLSRLLEIGCEQFGLEVGIVSRVHGDHCEVLAIRAPESLGVRRGATFPLDATGCRKALASARPVDEPQIAAAAGGPIGRAALPFQSYLGTALRVDGDAIGTLAFGGLHPRRDRFSASQRDLLTLMAHWLAAHLAGGTPHPAAPAIQAAVPAAGTPPPEPAAVAQPPAREAPAAAKPRPRPAAAEPRRLSPGWERRRADALPAPKLPRLLKLNPRLRRLERRLQRAAGSRVGLSLKLAPDLAAAPDPRLPIDALALSLVGHAAEALPGGGRIEVSSANLEVAASPPDVVPAVAPAEYVTLAVRATGEHVDPDAFSCAFDAPAAQVSLTGQSGRLPLHVLYRMLQRCGGDLSVDVERGRGVRFTVFLPRALQAARSQALEQPAAPPPA
jgi:hypothetical protein